MYSGNLSGSPESTGLIVRPSPNVIVLEDEELMSALILKYLNNVATDLKQPIHIQSLSSGWELLTQDLSNVKVAVVDILLPRVTGVDLIRDFKKRYPNMGIVPISGLATEPMKRNLKEILTPDFKLLPKPLRKEDFIAAFKNAWNLEQLPQQLGPTPTQEADVEQPWSVVQGSQNNISIVRRRLSPPKKAS